MVERKENQRDVSHGGFSIQRIYVHLRTGKRVTKQEEKNWFKMIHVRKDPTELLWRVSYKGQFVYLWQVTLEHMASEFRP